MDDAERAALATQYADAENLDARIQLHMDHEVADRDWWPWVFDRYDAIPEDATVLEVGGGTGLLWQENADRVSEGWDLLLTDFSPGMAGEGRENVTEAGVDAPFAVTAAEALPLPDESVDAVVANHMLYHVDRETALPELHRVLRPGGRLYATTNGEANMEELYDLLRATTDYEPVAAANFSLENGPAQLEGVFDDVARFDREAKLVVPALEPLVAYTASLPGVDEQQVADFAEMADERLSDGPLEIGKSMGMLVGEKSG
ncbi:class I SAM-dependent methyltransferase [Halobacteriales archaeon Cl-PHB]